MSNDEHYPVSPGQFAAFGAIIQWFACHELLMQMTMAGIMKSDLNAVLALTSGHGYAGKRDAFQSLLRVAHVPPEIDIEKLRGFVGEIHKHSSLRNKIAHCTWTPGTRPNSIKPTEMMVRGGKAEFVGVDDDDTDYTEAELIQIANELTQLHHRFHAYLDETGLLAAIAEKIEPISSDTSSSPGKPSSK